MKNKHLIIVFILSIFLLLFLSGCKQHNYDEAWIIGKTSAEIETEYGNFDRLAMPYDGDGLLKNCRAGYIIKPSRQSFWGRTTEELFCVYFDKNGIAVKAEVCSGNWGG